MVQCKRLRFGVSFHLYSQSTQKNNSQAVHAGRFCGLSIEAKVFVFLGYCREYLTYLYLAIDWSASETSVCRIVFCIENSLNAIWTIPSARKETSL
jgi:hypothetical protein